MHSIPLVHTKISIWVMSLALIVFFVSPLSLLAATTSFGSEDAGPSGGGILVAQSPTATLSVTPSTVIIPITGTNTSQVYLTWSSTNATTCSIVRQKPDLTKSTLPTGGAKSGSYTDNALSVGFTNYELTCTGGGTSVKVTKTVIGQSASTGAGYGGSVGVGGCPGGICGAPGPIYFPCSYNLNSDKTAVGLGDKSATIASGENVILKWSSFIAYGNSASIINYGPIYPVPGGTLVNYGTISILEGTANVSPTQTTSYYVQCTWGGTTIYGYSGGTTNSNLVTLNVAAPSVGGSCSVSPSSIISGGSATWTATPSGGNGTYTYAWSGTDGLAGSSATVNKTYSTTGSKTGTVTITSAGSPSAVQCSNSLTVSNPTPQCSDGIDNDGDGLIDAADYGCSASGGGGNIANDPTESPNPQCSDGIDNNGNGLIDTADVSACTGPTDSNEQSLPTSTLSLTGPALVQSASSATLTWSVLNVRAGSCTLTGTNGDSWNLTGTSGSNVTSAISGEATFTLRCLDLSGNPTSRTHSVKVAPSFEEI